MRGSRQFSRVTFANDGWQRQHGDIILKAAGLGCPCGQTVRTTHHLCLTGRTCDCPAASNRLLGRGLVRCYHAL
jgi:hypothetical protein